MSSANRGRKSVPWGLAGALALVAAVEGLVGAHPLDLSTPPRFEWRQSRVAATAEAPKATVLALGTSMTKLGLYAPVVGREAARPTLNLAQCGGRMQSAFYLLRHALEAGSRPEAILLEVHPIYMTIPFDDGLMAWADLLDWDDLVDLAQASFRPNFVAKTVAELLIPSVRSRHEIRDLALRNLRGDGNFNRSANSALVRHFAQNAGSHVNHRLTPYGGETHPFIAGMYLPATWRIDPTNARFLRRILRLCQKREIPVYWLVPPVAPLLQFDRDARGLEAAYDAWMGHLRAEFPEVVVLDARRSGYPPAVFFDSAHLDYPGAVAFSAEVGRALRRDLADHPRPRAGAPRIDLPPYRDQPGQPPLEDMAETHQILVDASSKVRK